MSEYRKTIKDLHGDRIVVEVENKSVCVRAYETSALQWGEVGEAFMELSPAATAKLIATLAKALAAVNGDE